MSRFTAAFDSEFKGEPPGYASWRKSIVGEFPFEFREAIRRNHMRIVSRIDYDTANRRLVELQERLAMPGTTLKACSSREQVEEWADLFTKRIEGEFQAVAAADGLPSAVHWIRGECEQRGTDIPTKKHPLELLGEAKAGSEDAKRALIAGIARVLDPRWWVRRICREQARIMEQTARLLRMVSVYESPYCSLYTLRNRESQKRRNREMLEAMEAFDPLSGECVNLSDAVDASVANPVNRRHELMVRMRGFEDVASMLGHVGMFYTITCPSKFHPELSRKRARNPRYNGSTPREAQAYLVELWARIRAALHRRGIRIYGFRVAEPHHDGTPHWHMLLFLEPERAEEATRLMRFYAMQEDVTEPGADKYRFEAVRIDTEKGSATGYIAKYISKNIDGASIDHDDEANLPGIEGAMRVEAWASCWGIRQFQQIGGPSVTVWRELRRLSSDEIEDYAQQYDIWDAVPNNPDLLPLADTTERATGTVRRLWEAADAADWAAYVLHQGGPLVARAAQVLRPFREAAELFGVPQENQYGEIVERIKGVTTGIINGIVTRAVRWYIRRASGNERSEAQQGATAPPWSSVNNCTEPVTRQPGAADRELIELDFIRGAAA